MTSDRILTWWESFTTIDGITRYGRFPIIQWSETLEWNVAAWITLLSTSPTSFEYRCYAQPRMELGVLSINSDSLLQAMKSFDHHLANAGWFPLTKAQTQKLIILK